MKALFPAEQNSKVPTAQSFKQSKVARCHHGPFKPQSDLQKPFLQAAYTTRRALCARRHVITRRLITKNFIDGVLLATAFGHTFLGGLVEAAMMLR